MRSVVESQWKLVSSFYLLLWLLMGATFATTKTTTFDEKNVKDFTVSKVVNQIESELECAVKCMSLGETNCNTIQFDSDNEECTLGFIDANQMVEGGKKVRTTQQFSSTPTESESSNPNILPSTESCMAFVSIGKTTFDAAQAACSAQGGTVLPEVYDDATYNKLKELIDASTKPSDKVDKLWINLKLEGGAWKWQKSQTPLQSYQTAFYSKNDLDTDQNCATIDVKTRKIKSEDCSKDIGEAIICQNC